MQRLGIDLGGTKIEGLVLDDQGQERRRIRVPTPRDDYGNLLAALLTLIDRCQQECGEVGRIGLGIPGSMSPRDGRIRNANLQILNGQYLLSDLQQQLPQPVALANDANCLAVSEFHDGAAADAGNSCFAVIIGTGCGGGVVANGGLLTGCNGVAGEWGHNPLPNYTPEVDGELDRCYCGLYHCQELMLSGTGFGAGFNRRYQTSERSEWIIARMREGDSRALAHFDLYCDQLSRALAAVVNLLDPEVIVLGGGMSNVDELYDELPRRLPHYVFSDVLNTPIRKALHGDSSGVRGAAWLE